MLKIYKPAGYENYAALPSLYVNDGFKAIEYCKYINVLDNLIADKKISPVVVVFIDYIEGDQNYFLNTTDEYFTAICKELVPLIDKNYKTSKKPEMRVLAGISAGAHISLLAPFKQPDKFLNAAGQSATITTELLDAVKNPSVNKTNYKSLRFYFDVGRYDLISSGIENQPFLYSNQMLDAEMNRCGITHSFKIVNDGHQWASWRERIDEILIYFFGL
jgi:enterochelin esterase family protein